MIAGILLAILIPIACFSWCCCRRQHKLRKRGKEDPIARMITGSRLSLNTETYHSATPLKRQPLEMATWTPKKNGDKDSSSSGVSSTARPAPVVDATNNSPGASTFSSDSPVQPSNGNAENSRRRYDATYYTHEPRVGPNNDFPEHSIDNDVDHLNTAV